MDQFHAGGINLVYFVCCALPALISHWKNGLLEKKAVLWCTLLPECPAVFWPLCWPPIWMSPYCEDFLVFSCCLSAAGAVSQVEGKPVHNESVRRTKSPLPLVLHSFFPKGGICYIMGFLELFFNRTGPCNGCLCRSRMQGLGMRRATPGKMVLVGLYFGLFRPACLWWDILWRRAFSSAIRSVDHWIAFGLLSVIGRQYAQRR